MHEFAQFVSNHWLLCGAFIVVLIILFVIEARTAGVGNGKSLSPQLLTRAINHDGAVLVDIRDSSAFRDGHIVGALNIPASQWETQHSKLDKHISSPIILIDAMGNKVQPFITKLSKAGFEDVRSLSGGLNAWRTAKMPLVKGAK